MDIDNARWQTLSALFDRALDLAPGEREALIARECAGDAGLAAQLRRMLDAADADSPLDGAAPAMIALEDEPEPAQAGDRLGGWILDGEIGRGGMGVVHAAHRDDGDTHQRAAIKRLRMRWDGSPQAQRFAHERRILARLSHHNIPRLLDHGVDAAGRPWFAQEFIDGRDLLAHADANRLDLRARIELFRQVCAAVQHAHEHFVVHRDLKPSNILVDPDGHAKVLDFGVAKRLDAEDAESTRTGAGAGYTPQYAAPEQVTGEAITAATDVYALGVILYQLLSGRLPYAFDAGNLSALAQAITARTPERLDKAIADGDAAAIRERLQARATSELAFRRFVRGDLSRIVQTALAKEPQRRYSSVLQMSLDLRRFLSGRPVSVAGNSFGYRTGKFVQRNRWAVALGTLALGAVLAGSIVSVVQMRSAQAQAAKATAEAARADAEADRARLAATRAERSVDFLRAVLQAGSRSAGGRPDMTLLEALDLTVAQTETSSESPDIVADGLVSAAVSYDEMGLRDKARATLEKARLLQEQRLPDDKALRGRILAQQGWLLAHESPRRGQALAEEALRLQRAAVPQDETGLVEAMSIVVVFHANTGDYDKAMELTRELRKRRLANGASELNDDIITLWQNEAILLSLMKRGDESIAAHRKAIELRERALGPEALGTLMERLGLLQSLNRVGRSADGLAEAEQLLPRLRAVVGEDHVNSRDVESALAIGYYQTRQYDKALPWLQRCFDWGIAHHSNWLGDLAERYPQALRALGREADAARVEARYKAYLAAREARDAAPAGTP